MTTPIEREPWINTFYVGGKFVMQEEYIHTPVSIGEGIALFIEGNIRRYRITDIWFSHDKNGAFGVGRHVFLKDVTGTDDDRLGILAPEYYSV